ncbi:hypothetical protein [Flavobacterium tructae]|uniref:Uncharacterized protein n=1 Tax=Flavobacterium tructae TaxID=1114873 RepID=A0A1S1J1I1_9FLAO|nr:hypothetical protein [Flavobacterium tructae]OHT44467.1 hypothetical protein BHE19_12170 [Flavobacterium tructae]OXB19397.1 hypothetical protein B0A71_12700 [Flavobacterium tructae]
MKKQDQIRFYRRQLESSKEMQALAMQNYNIAAQIESEATSALEVLGASLERTRKGEHKLSDKARISLLGSLTK